MMNRDCSYSLIDNELFKDRASDNSIFVQVHSDPFKDWFIEITQFYLSEQGEISIDYHVCAVPKNTTDDHVLSLDEQLKELMNAVICDMVNKIAQELDTPTE